MFHIEGIKLYLCISQVIYRSSNILAANITINQNIAGLVGKNETHLTCSFTTNINQKILNVAIIARNKEELFKTEESVAIFPPDEAAMLLPSGYYLSGRVTLTNISKVSTSATMKFDSLQCGDDNDYICTLNYRNDFGIVNIDKSEPTSVLVKALPSMPDTISSYVIASVRKEKQNNSSASFLINRNNIATSTNRNSRSSLLTYTVNQTPLLTTETSVPSFREGDTVQFICTGNIGKPPGRFVWQIIPHQRDVIFYSNEPTVVIDQIPDICSYRGTSNLTVNITADHFKAKVRCVEESQASVMGMFVETKALNVFYPVRDLKLTKQPNQEQYDKKTPTITLTCTGDGNPKPTFKWFRQENTRSILSWTDLYIIEDAVQNNSGVYICEAYNTIDDIEYNANCSVKIDIVDKLWSSSESESLKISAVYVILILCAVVIGVLVVALGVRKFHSNRHNIKTKEQNCCQKLMNYFRNWCGSNVNSTTDNNVPLTELKGTSDVKQERKSNYRSSGEDKNQVTTVDINPKLEANSIYADPNDAINQSEKTDLDISYTA